MVRGVSSPAADSRPGLLALRPPPPDGDDDDQDDEPDRPEDHGQTQWMHADSRQAQWVHGQHPFGNTWLAGVPDIRNLTPCIWSRARIRRIPSPSYGRSHHLTYPRIFATPTPYGRKISALVASEPELPPAIRTRPSSSRVAVAGPVRDAFISPMDWNLPVVGSRISADPPAPPASRTRPSSSRVAVSPTRGADIDPIVVKASVFGSKISADARGFSAMALPSPPASRTRPSRRVTAAGATRAVATDPAVWKAPEPGS